MTKVSFEFRITKSMLIALFSLFIAENAKAAAYEAEDYSIEKGCKAASNHTDFNGSGFVDMGGEQTWFSYDNVDVQNSGTYTLTFRYASRDNQNRRCRVFINDVPAGEIEFAPTGGWNQWSVDSINVNLESGPNDIRVEAITSEGGPNIDLFELKGKETTTKSYLTVRNGSGDGEYILGKTITITCDEAPENKIFDRWIVNTGNAWIEDVYSPHTTVEMPDNDVTITAFFKDTAPQEHEAFGELNFAIVLLDYAGDGSAQPAEEIEEGFFSGEYSVANFIEKASYGRTKMVGDVFGWISPPNALYGSGEQWSNCWPLDRDRFNALLDAYPYVDLDAYDGFVFYVHRHPDSECHALGVSTTIGLESVETYTSFGAIQTRTSYVATDFYFPYQAYSRITDSTAAHEIVHSLGIGFHSLSYICGESTLSTNPSDCYIQAYGDIFSIMGLRSQASHPNVVISERLGWLDNQNIITVSEGGRYKINTLEGQSQNIKAIKVPLRQPIQIANNKKIDNLYVEYRGMTGFDERNKWFRNIALNDGSKKTIDNIHGALIHGADCSDDDTCFPYLLDMHPGSVDAAYPPNKVAQAYLYAGESFEIPMNNVAIRVLDVDPGRSIEVEVITNEAPPATECPENVIIRAVPDPNVPSHVNWTAGSTLLPVNDANSGFGCNACVYSSSRLVYTISSTKSFDCPSEINLTATAREGEALDGWEVNDSDPIPLSWANTYNGVKYCSYSGYNFRHELMQCR